jgi:hypothetical protein
MRIERSNLGKKRDQKRGNIGMSGNRKAKLATAACLLLAGSLLAASASAAGSASSAGANESFDYAMDAVHRLQETGIIAGMANGDLNLEGTLTRAQFAVILSKALNLDTTIANSDFTDVKDNAWYTGSIEALNNLIRKNGYTLGYPDGRFNPGGQISEAELIVLFDKALGVTVASASAQDKWYAPYIRAAVDNGILPENEQSQITADPANRAFTFYVSDYAFQHYKLDNGKTIYGAYHPEANVNSSAYSKDAAGTAK